MDDLAERFTNAIAELHAVTDAITPEQAAEDFDEVTLQGFWRDWTSLGGWAGALWRLLNQELEDAAAPAHDPDAPETGGSG
ncbi:MAG TPA: hypothetical protein VGB83_10430 [Actinomycetota bacterium]